MIPLYDNNPTARRPVVTRALLYLNVGIYLAVWLTGAQGVPEVYGFVPARAQLAFDAELPHVLTGMFLHANLGHLAWNMLFLHIFGDNVEDLLGRGRFLLFYLLSGLAGAVGQYLLEPSSVIPMIGASGAIAGVLGGYLVLHPRAPIVLLNPIPLLWLVMGPLLTLPAWLVVGYWFFGNLTGAFASMGEHAAGVAFFAHIGGFLAGLVLTRPLLGDTHPPADMRPFSATSDVRGSPERKIFWKDTDRPFWR